MGFSRRSINNLNECTVTLQKVAKRAIQYVDFLVYEGGRSTEEQYKIQKILLFNAGLDIGYMLGGAYLIERSKNTANNPERLRGFGKSIILQGGFLFAYDLITYFTLAADNDQLQLLLSGDGVGMSWRF